MLPAAKGPFLQYILDIRYMELLMMWFDREQVAESRMERWDTSHHAKTRFGYTFVRSDIYNNIYTLRNDIIRTRQQQHIRIVLQCTNITQRNTFFNIDLLHIFAVNILKSDDEFISLPFFSSTAFEILGYSHIPLELTRIYEGLTVLPGEYYGHKRIIIKGETFELVISWVTDL